MASSADNRHDRQRMEHLNKVLRAVRNVNQLITREKDRGRLLQTACHCLVETRGYLHSWLLQYDVAGTVVSAWQAGLGQEFDRFVARVKAGDPPPCVTAALAECPQVTVRRPAADCPECPVADDCGVGGALIVCLEHAGRVHGVLGVAMDADLLDDPEEHALLHEVAGDIAFALHALDEEDARREAETARARSEEEFRQLFTTAPVGIFSSSSRGRFLRANPELARILGADSPEQVVAHYTDLANQLYVDPDRRRQMLASLEKNGRVDGFVCELRTMRGDWRWAELSARIRERRPDGAFVIDGFVTDVTARMRAEDDRRRSEQEFRQLFENAPMGLFVTDSTGRALRVNPEMARMVGCGSSAEALERFTDLAAQLYVYPERRREFLAAIERDGEVKDFVYEARNMAGEHLWLKMDARIREWRADGTFVIDGFCRDITAEKLATDALRESERRYRQLFDSMIEGFAVHELLFDEAGEPRDYRFLAVNPAFEKLTGLRAADLVGNTLREVLPADHEFWLERYARVVTSHAEARFDAASEALHKRFEVFAFPLADNRFACTFRDVTERCAAETALRFQAQVLDQIQDVVTATDLEGTITYVNAACCRLLGRSREELVGSRVDRFGEDPEQGASQAEIARIARECGEWRGEMVNFDAAGNRVLLDCRVRLMRDAAGNPVAMCGISTDITARQAVIEALRESEERYRGLIEQAGDCVILHDLQGDIREVNDIACQTYGYSRDELLGMNVADLDPDFDERGGRGPFWDELAPYDSRTFEARQRDREGHEFPVEVRVSLVQLRGETLALAFARDISERREMENRLRQMEKMDAIGQLAGGVAHDFNNQLAVIMGYGDIMRRRLNDPDLRGYADSLLVAARRSADLTRQLLAFARKGHYRCVPVDLHDTVAEVVGILEHSIDKRITIVQRLEARPATVIGDPSQLQNMLLNLALNARDAMPGGGELIFASSIAELDAEYCASVPYSIVPGPYVRLCVTDNGCGMSDRVVARIFEPFFTTKETGKGTGMGLAAVYGTVKQHAGAINVYSEPGHGSTFRVYLPLVEEARAELPPRPTPVPASRPACVLVIDDEGLLRDLATEILETAGYQVHSAGDGVEACDWYREHWWEVDVVVLDLVMPRLAGREVFDRLRTINPRVKVLLASGYSINGEAQSLLDAGVLGFLQKPFSEADLTAAVARAVGTPPPDPRPQP